MTGGCLLTRDPAILKAMTTSIPSKTTVSYDSFKLGIDAHAKWYCGHFQFATLCHQHLKKRPTPKPLFRRCQRVGNDSQSGRLQLLFHQTTSTSTLRLDGPTHARLPTDHVIGHVAQPTLQALHRLIRHMAHPQRRSQHLCSVEEIAFQLTTIY